MEFGGFFDGVPLSSVKHARFINKLGGFFTLAKLIYNGMTYDYTSGGQGGTVVVDPGYLQWGFVAPDGVFDMEALEQLTLAGLLESVAGTEETNPIQSWEDFADWIAMPETAALIQKVFSSAAAGGIGGVAVPPPQFQPPANFPAFLRWLAETSGAAGSLPASQFTIETGFSWSVGLYESVKATLKTPSARPDLEDNTAILPPDYILYSSMQGVLDKLVLGVGPVLCDGFSDAYPGYDAIMYVYDETHDTLGLGLTAQPGWYAVNGQSFAFTPFDLAAHPIIIEPEHTQGKDGILWDAIYPMADLELAGQPGAVVSFRFQV